MTRPLRTATTGTSRARRWTTCQTAPGGARGRRGAGRARVGLWSAIFTFAHACPAAAPQMRQRASPKCRSRRMAPRVGVSWGPGVCVWGVHWAALLTLSPGVDEQSESSEESEEEEKPPEEDKEEEEEKKAPTPQEKKRRKGSWGLSRSRRWGGSGALGSPLTPLLCPADSSDESDSSEDSDIDSETSSALFMAVRQSRPAGAGVAVRPSDSHPNLCRRRRPPPRGSGSHQGAVLRAPVGQERPVWKQPAPLPLCGLQPASWSRVSAGRGRPGETLRAAVRPPVSILHTRCPICAPSCTHT